MTKKLYKEYKYNKKLANSGMTYIGTSTNMALMTMALNNASAGSRAMGKKRVAEILSEYGNTYSDKQAQKQVEKTKQ